MISRPSKSRLAGLALCVLLLAGFAARQASVTLPTAPQSSAPIPRLDLVLAELAVQTERLRRPIPGLVPGTHRAARDAFTNARTPAPVFEAPAVVASPPAPLAVVPDTSAPDLTLVGIAEDDERGTLERTAVIGGVNDAVFVVKAGEAIEGRYRVGRVGPETVEIVDLASGVTFTLALK